MGSSPAGRAIIKLRDVAQLGSASGLGPEGRRFESCHLDHFDGGLAQLGEHLPCTQGVVGSSPITSTINFGGVAQLV